MFAIPQNWGFLASRRHLGQAYGAGSAASAWAALRRGRHRPWAQSGARARFASRGSRRWRTFPCPGHIFSRVKILGTSGIQIKHDKTWIGLSLHRHPGIRAWDDVCFFCFGMTWEDAFWWSNFRGPVLKTKLADWPVMFPPQLVAFGDPSGSQFYNSKVQSKNYSAIKHGNGKFMEMQFLIYKWGFNVNIIDKWWFSSKHCFITEGKEGKEKHVHFSACPKSFSSNSGGT